MTKFNFADRYAQAGLSPSAEIIVKRQETVERIAEDITNDQILDLVSAYYDAGDVDLTWFRDEFLTNDPIFSLVDNERECRTLAAIILGIRVAEECAVTVLAVVSGSISGKRNPSEGQWLVGETVATLNRMAIEDRRPADTEMKVTPTTQQKLNDEIAAVPQNDWPALIAVLGKIRSEAQSSTKTVANQSAAHIKTLKRELRLQREEGQMLWWFVGGYSRALERDFASLNVTQAAIAAAVDLANLTAVSTVGPLAAPALIERILGRAHKTKTTSASQKLDKAVESLTRDELNQLQIKHVELPPHIAPITAAIELARTIGTGAWQKRFVELTGLDASTEFEPIKLAAQIYREHLLSQLL